jgi:hypothetical protein
MSQSYLNIGDGTGKVKRQESRSKEDIVYFVIDSLHDSEFVYCFNNQFSDVELKSMREKRKLINKTIMELKEFIKETLFQITHGIKESQAELDETGAIIVPKFTYKNVESFHISDHFSANQEVNEIKFKVGVTVEAKSGGKSGLGVLTGVFTAGAQASSESVNQSISTIEFTIPIVFPPGNDPGILQGERAGTRNII